MDVNIVILVYMGLLGSAFGSFSLAMVDRMKSGKDWVRGRSECDDCGHKLRPIDLVPVLSWASTGGRCRYCRVELSKYYPLVEAVCSAVFAVSYTVSAGSLAGFIQITSFGLWLVGVVIMAALAVFDFRWYLLPNKLVYPLIYIASLQWILGFFIIQDQSNLQYALSGAVSVAIGWGLFFALHRISNGKWIGDGDYRLGAAIGLFLGNPLLTWLSLFLASVVGLLAALITYLRGKTIKSTKIPFGPFLMIGLFVSYLWGQQLIDWYSSTFLYL